MSAILRVERSPSGYLRYDDDLLVLKQWPVLSARFRSRVFRLPNSHHPDRVTSLWSLWSVVIAGEAIFVLPFVLPRLFRPTMLSAWGLTNFDIGLAFSMYGTVAVFAYFLGGPIADRWNNRRLMSVALLATAAGAVALWSVPTPGMLKWLYAYFGCTTILLFWAPLIRVTHRLANPSNRGTAFGLLDAGRGLFAAILASVLTLVFDQMTQAGGDGAAVQALKAIVVISALMVAMSACLLFIALPDRQGGETPSSGREFRLASVPMLIKRPGIWLQSLIVLCAYCGYKSIDNVGVYVVDVIGGTESDAAWMTTLCFWMRPISAVGAGVLADRLGRFSTLSSMFVVMAVGCLVMAWGNPVVVSMAGLSVVIASTAAAVFGLRGVYFAVFDELETPTYLIGTATGVVSVVGFMPDVFFGAVTGQVLDQYPGLMGHRIVYGGVAAIAAIGVFAAACSAKMVAKQAS